MKTDNILSTLGLALRAGKVVSGEFMTENAVKSHQAQLVVIATDVSDNTRKKFHNMCEFHQVAIREYATKDDLGHSLGKEFRASLAVTDEGFAKAILKKMD
ncbi:MAG: ribosomal L7Ae/L30e/S12e/Gadd45 family protein [Butyribacter sp.]|nr:ribosomal L7Ae/L30e/S12e/Gadd45 family protein [bacterium]MDY3853452.1 ribosomal L7Ae/L30e/S12e/Gadd45 family protein [Butyribacter sp.]